MFKSDHFSEQVKSFRGQKSLREAAVETGISASTLSRIERGFVPDVNTFLALVVWMARDVDEFTDMNKACEIVQRQIANIPNEMKTIVDLQIPVDTPNAN